MVLKTSRTTVHASLFVFNKIFIIFFISVFHLVAVNNKDILNDDALLIAFYARKICVEDHITGIRKPSVF